MAEMESRMFERLPRHALSRVPASTYASVNCLALTFDWVDDPKQSQWESEVADLRKLLENRYYFTFEHKRMSARSADVCGTDIRAHTGEFVRYYGEKNNLLVLIYGGHGSVGSQQDKWFGAS